MALVSSYLSFSICLTLSFSLDHAALVDVVAMVCGSQHRLLVLTLALGRGFKLSSAVWLVRL